MPKIEFEGLDIEVHRSKIDGRLVIDIATQDLEGDDVFEQDDLPRLAIYVNEERLETTAEGGWKIGHRLVDDSVVVSPSSLRHPPSSLR